MYKQMAIAQHKGINVWYPVNYIQEYLKINIINIIQ